jgi:hypothetical protein
MGYIGPSVVNAKASLLRDGNGLIALVVDGPGFKDRFGGRYVFCSFLALLLKVELERRMKFADLEREWAQALRDLEASQQVEATFEQKRFLLRSQLTDEASAAPRAAGHSNPKRSKRMVAQRTQPLRIYADHHDEERKRKQ